MISTRTIPFPAPGLTTGFKWKSARPHSIFIVFLLLITIQAFTVDSLNEHHRHHQNQDQLTEQTSARSYNNGSCPKSWVFQHSGQKCFKIAMTPKNYEIAKARCQEWAAKLAVIDDDSSKEREASSGPTSSDIFSNLSLGEQKKAEFQTRQFYVTLNSDLLNQYQSWYLNGLSSENFNSDFHDHMDSETSISSLWLPRDDPILQNITTNLPNKLDSNTAFVLAYSRHYGRWGIVPISSTRKMPFICERQPLTSNQSISNSSAPSFSLLNQSSPSAQNQPSDQPKSNNDLTGQPSNNSPSLSSESRFISSSSRSERDHTSTTPQPDSSSMFFREFPVDQSVVLGSTAEMRCSPIDSESTLTWTLDGLNLTQTSRIKIFPNGTLRIEQVRNLDDGNYTCTIHSGGMSESKTARIGIIQKPHHPEYITAELLDKLSTSVRVKWAPPGFDGNSPILKYSVEMRTVNNDNADNDPTSIISPNSWEVAKANISADQTSVIIPDLKPAKKYVFRTKATNRIGTSDPSLPTKPAIEVPVQPPSQAPEGLSGTPKSSTSILVQWLPPPVDSQNGMIKGYKIRHKLAGYASDSDWYTSNVEDGAHLNYVLEDLIVWQNYEIQVAAENDKGVGPFSSSIQIRTKEGKPDKGPRNLVAEALSSSTIKVNWSPPPPQHINGVNLGYKVQAWTDPRHTQLAKELLVPHNTVSPLHSSLIDGLQPYTDYHITVRCFTSAGDGPINDEIVVVKTKQDLPEAVSSLEFTEVLDKSLRVNWKPPRRTNGELEHYTLEYFESSLVDKRFIKKFPASATDARITDLLPQTSYTFKIYPHTSIGRGPEKVNRTTTSVPPVHPEPPSQLFASSVSSSFVTIQFNPGFDGNAHIEKWIAEAITPSRGEYEPRWTTIYISTNHTRNDAVVVRNLKPFTRYKIRLTPVNIVGPSHYPSEPTPEFQTTQIEPEQPPRDFTIDEVNSTSVVARWSPLSNSLWLGNARGYNLTWNEVNNSTLMSTFINDTKAHSLVVKDLEEFTEYTFKIYAVNDVGLSPPSESVTITTLEDVPTASPSNLTARAISSTAISVDWSSVPKRHRNGIIRGYKIQHQANKENSRLLVKVVEDNTTKHVVLNDLKPFTTYSIAVAAFTTVGDGVFSNVLSAQTLEDAPGTPQNVSVPSVSQTSARLIWDPPEDSNGDIIGYKISYHPTEGSKETISHELNQNERTFKANNLKPKTYYMLTVTAKTRQGWGLPASTLFYTTDSQLRANLPFYRETWFVILCACSSIVITIIVTAILSIQNKSYKYRQDMIKSTSQDRLGDAAFAIDDETTNHYNSNGFGLLSNGSSHHRRSNGALSQSTANFTLPKSPPRPHPGSVAYSDDGDDDVFEDIVDKQAIKSVAGTSNYDSSGDSLTEKPSEISSSTGPESGSVDEDYVNTGGSRKFTTHYANVNGSIHGHKSWKKNSKSHAASSSQRTRPKLPQRPAPSVPQVPGEPSSSGSDNNGNGGNSTSLNENGEPAPGTSGLQQTYGDSMTNPKNRVSKLQQAANQQPQPIVRQVNGTNHVNGMNGEQMQNQNGTSSTQQDDLLNGHLLNLNGGRIIVDNMAGSRAPLPGFTSFV